MIRKLLLGAAGAAWAWAALAGPPTSSFQLGGSQPAPEPSLGERLTLASTDPLLLLYLGLTLLAAALFLLARGKVRKWLRWGMLLSSLAVLGFYFGGCPCPVGSVTKLGFIFTDPVVYLIPFVLFLVPVVAALLSGRVFCGWVCPLGAVLALATGVGLARKEVDAESCVSCGLCARGCALGAIEMKGGKTCLTGECIRCGDCALACRRGALS